MAASSADAVAKRMREVGEAVQKGQESSVRKAAIAAKTVHTAAMLADAPGGRLRNVGKNGGKLSVRYRLSGGLSNPSAVVEAVGPWQIMNNPAKPHLIQGRKGKALHFGGEFRQHVNHPGHRGKRTWQNAEPLGRGGATRVLNRTMISTVQRAFKG